MRALILTAGLGTRLRPLTFVRAKAAVPVNGEPIVRRVIGWLVAQGIGDLVLNLHHRPASITGIVGDGRDLGARVRYSWENPVLGSAGGPRHALPLLMDSQGAAADDPSTFLLVNGDTLTDLRLDRLIDAHRTSPAAVTMALVPNRRPDMYGGVLADGERVTGFTPRGSARESFHFVGVQVTSATVFAQLEDGVPAETVMELYPRLIAANPESVRAHRTDARFRDVGTPNEYWETSVQIATVEGDRLVSRNQVSIHPSADVRRTIVWDNVRIAAGCQLEDCIVCDGVRLPERAVYRRCAIVPYAGEPLREGERVVDRLLISPF